MSGNLFLTVLVTGAFSVFVIALAWGSIYTGLKPRGPTARQAGSEPPLGDLDPSKATEVSRSSF